MTFLINEWMEELASKIQNGFGERVCFIGLQGSYRRNEATANSDIDVVVLLNELTLNDLEKYRAIIAQMPDHEKACGFISGKREIIDWEKSDLFQFYYDTQPIYGSLDFLLPLIHREDVKRAVKMGACNLYHASCHNFLYEKSAENISALCKSAFFILQAKYFLEADEYIGSKRELEKQLTGMDKEVLNMCIERKRKTAIEEAEFTLCHEKLISWSSNLIHTY